MKQDRNPVIVIAEKCDHDLYHCLQLTVDSIQIIHPEDSRDFIKNNGADVVLMDCGYNVYEGLALLKEIKMSSQEIPVIFLTDVSSENICIKAFRTGVRDYFRKPFNLSVLRCTIENLLKVKRTSKEKRAAYSVFTEDMSPGINNSITSDIPPNILRAVRYIERNLSDKFSLDDLSREARISKFHFCKVFKQHMGMPAKEFIKLLRIHRAKALLIRKDLTITCVAMEVGILDLSNFIRQFKEVTGITPSDYRASVQKKVLFDSKNGQNSTGSMTVNCNIY